MANISTWLEATRPKTLPAAVVPVLLGSALAQAEGSFVLPAALLCLVFALLIQIGTNFANDYLDARSGADTADRIGPTRAVAAGLVSASTMRKAAVAVLVLAFCTGLGLIPYGGWWLLLIGIASVACAWLYTGGPYPLAYNGLGDIFVVFFFGLVAVGCTYFVQTGSLHGEVLLLGLGSGLLINNLLVVNNYRDVEEDRRAAKRTLVVRFGRRSALIQYIFSGLVAGGIVLFFYFGGYGAAVLLALLPISGSLLLAAKLAHAKDLPGFQSSLKGTGLVAFAYGILFAAGLIF